MSNKNPVQIRQERYINILNAVQESSLWLDIETLSTLSGVSKGLCKPLIDQLVNEGLAGERVRQSCNSPAGTTLYAKPSIAGDYEQKQSLETEYVKAKSSFQLMPHALNGGVPKKYVAKLSPQESLAMLSRRAQ